MKLLITYLNLLALVLTSSAQTALPPPSQDLFPMENGITYHSPAYYSKLRSVLFDNRDTGDPFASRILSEDDFQFLRLPPFTPETLLTVSRKGTNYVATVIIPLKQIWSYKGDIANLAVSKKEKYLPAPIAQRTDRLWREMLIRARFAEKGVCPDDVSYCFFKWIKGVGNLAGETNPRKNTRPSMLVGIAFLLVEFVNDDAKKEDSTLTNLVVRIGQLETELNTVKERSNQSAHETR